MNKKNFVPTEKACMMVQMLSEDITYPDITAQWEKSLDAISRREMKVRDFFAQQTSFLDIFFFASSMISAYCLSLL